MKKKGARDIPDFSHRMPARPQGASADASATHKAAPPPVARTPVKPHATSQKSGRRGQ